MRSFQFLSVVLLAGLIFTSCQKEDQVLPEKVKQNKAIKQRDLPAEQTIKFISWQDLLVTPPDCPFTAKTFVSEHDDTPPSRVAGCLGDYGFEGTGSGYLEGFDRFYIQSSLKYDAVAHTYTGLIDFNFASYNSNLRLRIQGPGKTYHDAEEGAMIEIPVAYYAGSGIFEDYEFDGVLKIMHADEIFDAQNTEYHATLLVDGEFITY